VDANRKRFMNEGEYWFRRSRKVLDLPGQKYYAIFDSNNALTEGIDPDAGVEAGMVFKADSLDALAEKIGINSAALKGTVNTYNSAASNGWDGEFEGPGETQLNRSAALLCGSGGFKLQQWFFWRAQDQRQLPGSGLHNQPIPSLYAAGEVANGEIFYKAYPISGSAIQCYTSMGRIAGAHAADNL
jgi:fumarate reductase flavoprotein subunit